MITHVENNVFKNKVQRILKRAKNQYYRKLFDENIHNLRKTWKTIKYLCGSVNKNHVDKISLNNVDYFSDQDIAKCFNEHFSTVAHVLEAKLPHITRDPLSYVTDRNYPDFELTPFTIEECKSIISNLKITKQGRDSIPIPFFKECRSV